MRFLALLAVLFATRTALAHPPPPPELVEPEPTSWRDDRAFFEWSSWIRLAYGMQNTPSDVIARSITPTPTRLYDREGAWDVGLGADMTFPFPTKHWRLGPWIELRPQGVFTGGELSIAGQDLDMFMYEGERVYTLRVGSSTTDVTASLAFGYRCPWKLWGPYNRATRYMIGARLVATATRSATDPHDWSGSFGIEFEPVGALRYVAAIKSWY
ncbi:MAG TPA: hypothetical protein VLB44_05145 [Kofleriaceae bacterium]|nr:hypothetical protein [Kofleriaceae bacterium]